jgi:hypothetical protein
MPSLQPKTQIQSLQAELARCAAAAARAPAPAPAPAPSRTPAAKAVAAAAAAPAALFHFSSLEQHKYSSVDVSDDRLAVTSEAGAVPSEAWARSERGVAAGCGAVRWAVQIGKERVAWKKWDCFRVGVASDYFSGCTETWRVLSWFFENECMVANGQQQGDKFHPEPFPSGDVVTFELERDGREQEAGFSEQTRRPTAMLIQ